MKGIRTAARLRRLVERREESFDEDRGAEEDGLQSAGQADHERDPASSGVKGFELSHPNSMIPAPALIVGGPGPGRRTERAETDQHFDNSAHVRSLFFHRPSGL